MLPLLFLNITLSRYLCQHIKKLCFVLDLPSESRWIPYNCGGQEELYALVRIIRYAKFATQVKITNAIFPVFLYGDKNTNAPYYNVFCFRHEIVRFGFLDLL